MEAPYAALEAANSGWRGYEARFLVADVTAGVTLGTMCLAQTLAHATIATTDPIQGAFCT